MSNVQEIPLKPGQIIFVDFKDESYRLIDTESGRMVELVGKNPQTNIWDHFEYALLVQIPDILTTLSNLPPEAKIQILP